MDVQRTGLVIDVSNGAQNITGSEFIDVQRTGLVIDVSNGAPNITGSKVYRCPEDRPSNRCLQWSPKHHRLKGL
jgi:exoribonuclease II